MKRLIASMFVLALLLPSFAQAQAVLGPAANPTLKNVTIVSGAIPFIKASSGTMGNNGAVSAMTALPKTYSNGAYLYLPASAIEAGSAAGWYWFVASSTTAGTVYNSTYTSGIPRLGTATAFATTGPGAFTGVITAHHAITVTIPANSIGPNGLVTYSVTATNNNSAGTKTLLLYFGGASTMTLASTTATSGGGTAYVQNRGSAAVQSMSYETAHGATSNGAQIGTDGAQATTADVLARFNLQTGVATDHLVVERYRVDVEYLP
mgnify:CR=1 FL=1